MTYTRLSGQFNRAVAVRADTGTATVSGTLSDLTTYTEREDTYSAFNPTTGVFTTPVPGLYAISAQVQIGATFSGANAAHIAALVNGSVITRYFTAPPSNQGSSVLPLNFTWRLAAGDLLKFQVSSDATNPIVSSTATYNYLTITRLGV